MGLCRCDKRVDNGVTRAALGVWWQSQFSEAPQSRSYLLSARSKDNKPLYGRRVVTILILRGSAVKEVFVVCPPQTKQTFV